MIVRTDLPNALEHFNIDALLMRPAKKPDGMWRPACRSCDLRHHRAFGAAQRSERGAECDDDLARLSAPL